MPRGRKIKSFTKPRVRFCQIKIAQAIFERLLLMAHDKKMSIASIVQSILLAHFTTIGMTIDERLPLPVSIGRSRLVDLAALEERAKRLVQYNDLDLIKEIDELKRSLFLELVNFAWPKNLFTKEKIPNDLLEATMAQLKELGAWQHAKFRASFNGHRTTSDMIGQLWTNFQLTPLHRYPKTLWNHNGEYPRKQKPMPNIPAPTIEPQPIEEPPVVSIVDKMFTNGG